MKYIQATMIFALLQMVCGVSIATEFSVNDYVNLQINVLEESVSTLNKKLDLLQSKPDEYQEKEELLTEEGYHKINNHHAISGITTSKSSEFASQNSQQIQIWLDNNPQVKLRLDQLEEQFLQLTETLEEHLD